MPSHDRAPSLSYEVALGGGVGPAYLAALASVGVERPATTSLFLVPGSSEVDVCDVVAMLQERGLVILDVRRVSADRALGPSRALTDSSSAGDAMLHDSRDDVTSTPSTLEESERT